MAKSKKKASVQKPGKLMLNNPSIPPELDEDIDDDLAFNSDDEKMYGHFFDRSDAKKAHDDSEFPGDDDDFSEDDESYDLADALDESLAQERANLPKTSLKRRRGETQVREGESMYGTAGKGEDGLSGSYSRALASFMTKNKKNEAEESAFQRLEGTLKNKKNTIVMDEDDMTREKVDREQVRNLVQENLSKYKPIIREMSSSKHVVFPMKQANSNPISTTIGSVASSASQALTKEVGESSMSFAQKVAQRTNSLLSSAGLSGESHASALSSHDTFGDEVPIGGGEEEGEGVPSTGYIAKLKAMLAAESGRRKRFNKIKSKTYRRILRKEKEREKEKKEIAFQLLHPELARKRLSESLMKARAEERVTQKHKNTSAWVKQAKRFAKFDDNAKASIQEQLNIHQRLTQKMENEAGDDYYDVADRLSENSEEDEAFVDELVAGSVTEESRRKMVNSLFKEGDDATANSSDPFAKARSELKGMQFMKNAKERRMKEMRDELQALGDDVQNNTSETTIPAKRTSQKKKDTLERIVLQPGRGVDCGKVALDPENTAEEALNHGEPLPQSEFAGSRARGGKISHVKTIKPEAPRPASEEEPLSAPDSAAVEERPYDDELTKSYLVSRAFAQDEVDGEFLLKKNAQVDNVVEPLDRNAALPGWGEWGGENPSLNKRHKEKVAHYTLQKEIEKSFLLKSRADASLDHVVINHDGVELVPDRMTLHMVPRPFSNAQEFARSMRQPVGPEWSSSIGFKEGVQPRVEVQQGQAVVPLDVSNVPRKSKTKRRKT